MSREFGVVGFERGVDCLVSGSILQGITPYWSLRGSNVYFVCNTNGSFAPHIVSSLQVWRRQLRGLASAPWGITVGIMGLVEGSKTWRFWHCIRCNIFFGVAW